MKKQYTDPFRTNRDREYLQARLSDVTNLILDLVETMRESGALGNKETDSYARLRIHSEEDKFSIKELASRGELVAGTFYYNGNLYFATDPEHYIILHGDQL